MADGREAVQPVTVVPTGTAEVGLKASFEVWEDSERWAELLTRVHQELNEELRKRGVSAVRIQRRVTFWKWVDLTGEREVDHTERPDSVRVEMRARVFHVPVEDFSGRRAQRGGKQ